VDFALTLMTAVPLLPASFARWQHQSCCTLLRGSEDCQHADSIVSECILSYELSRTSRLDVANGVRVNSSLALEVLRAVDGVDSEQC